MDKILGKQDKIVWQNSEENIKNSRIYHFIEYIKNKYKLNIESYHDFYNWSIEYPEQFWQEFLDYSKIILDKKYTKIIDNKPQFNENKWFPDCKLNFAKNLLDSDYNYARNKDEPNYPALTAISESGSIEQYSIYEIKQQVYNLAEFLLEQGVKPGDRIAGFLPNIAEAVIAMLATTSKGAVWTACSPDFGDDAVKERFVQVEPTILLIVDGYYYKNKYFDCYNKNVSLISSLIPFGLQSIISINNSKKYKNNIKTEHNTPDIYNSNNINFTNVKCTDWQEIQKVVAINTKAGDLADITIDYVAVDYNSPVYIMYSSGTTGKPKCIVHGTGGVLTEHFKEHLLHHNVSSKDKFLYFTTTSWMMWHWQISAIGLGASILIYDGAPNYPHYDSLIALVEQHRITLFGASAKYFSGLEKFEQSISTNENIITLNKKYNLSSLNTIYSTGSPLLSEQYDYIADHIKSDVAICSISGGTDILGCFALGNPILPIYRSELQCRSLGMNIQFLNDNGESVVDQKAELVCMAPFPSMPIYFWNDPDGQRYYDAYFDRFDNIWAHGDYGKLTQNNGVIIYGRSDAVLNPGGVRIGTAEIYTEVEKIPEVIESLAVGQEYNHDERIVLFVVLQGNINLSEELKNKIIQQIRIGTTPRHVPAKIIQVPELPRTTSGKLVELAVKNIIAGKEVKNKHVIANPEVLSYFENISELL